MIELTPLSNFLLFSVSFRRETVSLSYLKKVRNKYLNWLKMFWTSDLKSRFDTISRISDYCLLQEYVFQGSQDSQARKTRIRPAALECPFLYLLHR